MDPFQQFEQRLRNEPQPTESTVRSRCGATAAILSWISGQPTGCCSSRQSDQAEPVPVELVADSGDAVTQISGIEVIGTSLCGIHAVAKYCCSIATQPLSKRCSGFRYRQWYRTCISRLLVRRGVRRATEGVQCEVAVPVSRCGGRVMDCFN